MSNNPYASQVPTGSSYSRGNPLQRLKPVAICLIVVASISIMSYIAVFIINAVTGQLMVGNMAESVGRLVGMTVPVLFQVGVLIGGIYMLKGKSWASCMGASIIAVIPACSPCVLLGIPFGIWAIVMLNQPDIKAAFRS